MSKRIFLCLCLVALLSSGAFAKQFQSANFTIQSELDSRFIDIVKTTAEAFYNNIKRNFPLIGWEQPLTIYYSKTESETNELLAGHGYSGEVSTSYYISTSPGVYVHQLDDEGEFAGWDSLFYGITSHFIRFNFRMPPEWFSCGLSGFLAKHSEIVNGELVMSGSKPGYNFALRDQIEEKRVNIRVLYQMSSENFKRALKDQTYHAHLAREVFHWLHEKNKLNLYLRNVKNYGYELSVLENIVSGGYGAINRELMDFLNKMCFAEASLSEALATDELVKKKEKFLEALKLKPDYHKARLGLVKCLYKSEDYQKCEENLQQIIDARQSAEHIQAAVLMGNLYYRRKDYSEALKYYNKAWEDSANYPYRYRIAYRIGNCHYYLKQHGVAKQWYQQFLTSKWNPNDMKLFVDYAEKYTNYEGPSSSESLKKETIPKTTTLNTR
ncbi:tetratricopeptide repeat protein [Planctomycetota bacterium]